MGDKQTKQLINVEDDLTQETLDNMRDKGVIKQQCYLFDDDLIFEEILTRLPVKSILRFKSVSKQWYSTLFSSAFTNIHLLKSLVSHRSALVETLFIKNCKNYYLFSCDDDDDGGDQVSNNFEGNYVKLDVSDFGLQNYDAELTGSSNGLICLTIFSKIYPIPGECLFVVWNPATQKVQRYESDGYNILDRDTIVARGFGYASSVDDYKYVRILTRSEGSIVHIFSLRKNKSRTIDLVFDHDEVIPFERVAVLIDEKLYWQAYSDTRQCIVTLSFDLEVDRFEIIQFNNVENVYSAVIGVVGGCLSRWDYGWTIGDDKLMHILESPTRVKSICLSKELILNNYSQMVGFTRTGKIFVTGMSVTSYNPNYPIDCRTTLQLLDIGTKPTQHSILMNFNGLVDIVKYVPSLASPFPSEESSKT